VAQPTRPSRAELNAGVELQRIQARAAVTIAAIRWVGLVVLAYFASQSVVALAGRTTLATIGVGIKLLGKVYISQAVAWLFAASSEGYGLRQRALRHNVIARLSPAVREREQALDPKRTSSELTERGRTKPQDEP
jgi:hypothetical protein